MGAKRGFIVTPRAADGDRDWLEEWRTARQALPPEDVPFRQEGSPFATYDLFDRKQLRRLGVADYLLVIARGEPARVRRVPSQAIAEEGVDDDGEFSLVTCPCGAKPIARAAIVKCGGCERYYARVGDAVFAAYGQMPVPALV